MVSDFVDEHNGSPMHQSIVSTDKYAREFLEQGRILDQGQIHQAN